MNRFPRLGWVLVVVLASLALASGALFLAGPIGCVMGCTNVDCGDSGLDFVSESGERWPSLGSFTVTMVLDGERIDLDYDPHGGTRASGFLSGLEVAVDSTGLRFTPNGPFSRGSMEITIRNARGEVQQTVTPEWKTTRPNGPGCAPECLGFQGELTLPDSMIEPPGPEPIDNVQIQVVHRENAPVFEGPDIDAIALSDGSGTVVYAMELTEMRDDVNRPVAILGAPDAVTSDGQCQQDATADFDHNGATVVVRMERPVKAGDELVVFDASDCLSAGHDPTVYDITLCIGRESGGCTLASVPTRSPGLLTFTVPLLPP